MSQGHVRNQTPSLENAQESRSVSSLPAKSAKRELLQAVIIVVCVALGIGIGWVLNGDHLAGALVGAPSGLMLGLVSGGFLLSSERFAKSRR